MQACGEYADKTRLCTSFLFSCLIWFYCSLLLRGSLEAPCCIRMSTAFINHAYYVSFVSFIYSTFILPSIIVFLSFLFIPLLLLFLPFFVFTTLTVHFTMRYLLYLILESTSTSASGSTVHIHQVPDRDPAEPPAKRRRGLAGSIVSTALSAALIGTAVGLTVYRLYVPSSYFSLSSFPDKHV